MPDEKFDEKDAEKREEKSPQEKSWDEKYHRDPVGLIVWACILIWAGLVLLASNLGFLAGLPERLPWIPGGLAAFNPNVWSIIALGAGGILLCEILIRLAVPEYRRPVGGTLILATIFIGSGLGGLFGVEFTWPLILIVLGLLVLFRGFFRGR
jgi:hypothetical protein